MRYFIQLSYNGYNYHGWQIQPNGNSVQAELQKALSLLLHQEIGIVGCGRTDSGVHALEFYAHFDVALELNEQDLTDLMLKLNSFLKEDIAIHNIVKVCSDAHARFSAVSRTYYYNISLQKTPFKSNLSYRIFYLPDVDLMNEAAKKLFQYDDFSCFSKSHTQTKTNNCRVFEAEWKRVGDELIFTISANRFLRNMVRAIVGTLLDVGRGKITIAEFEKIIQDKNRCNAGTSMPAKALFLAKVKYPDEIFS